MGLVIFIFGFCIIIWTIILIGKIQDKMYAKQKQIDFNREHPHYEAEQFYKSCTKMGVNDEIGRAHV